MARSKGQKHLRRRVDCRLDVAKALELRLERGLTLQEIGAIFGVSKQRVQQALKPFLAMLEDPGAIAAYRKCESQLLDGTRLVLLSHMLDSERLSKASVNNLAYAHRQMFDASRLLRGGSTENISLKASLVCAIPKPTA